ncbi:hypothetical protein F4819DRAFT_481347 [Hypoxylon fuscum]|nr:hypothetical protein F4819DRAFT_481347 [Hypoxylon fuscum]
MGTSQTTPHDNLAINQQASPQYERRPAHLQVEDARYSRSAFLSPSSARSAVLYSDQFLEKSSHLYGSSREHHWNETERPETGSFKARADTRTVRKDERSPLSLISRTSCSPIQPRQILLDVGQGVASESLTSIVEPDSRELNSVLSEPLAYEIHRPSPIAPPNHDCSWKHRYQALTAEIRLLKAELSTRASARETDIDYTAQGEETAAHEDDDLGILGITIIMHLRGRDDLVINTDLTQG